MANTKEGITTIFEQRNKFIIIGLTGRTGSGCSEVSKILQTEKFPKLKLETPKDHDFKTNEERKYRIIYNYAEKNWNPFQVINMSDMIFTFILQHKYSDLPKLINLLY